MYGQPPMNQPGMPGMPSFPQQPTYSQPVVVITQQQQQPNIPAVLGPTSCFCTCPSCGNKGYTVVTRDLNSQGLLLCVLLLFFLWCCLAWCCNGNFQTTHTCSIRLGSFYREEYLLFVCLRGETGNLAGEPWGTDKPLRVELHILDGESKSEMSWENAKLFSFSCFFFVTALIFTAVVARKILKYYSLNYEVHSPLMLMVFTLALLTVENFTKAFVFGLEGMTGIYSSHLLLLSQAFQTISLTAIAVVFVISIKFCTQDISQSERSTLSFLLAPILVLGSRAALIAGEVLLLPEEEQYFDILGPNSLGVLELFTSVAFLGWFLRTSNPNPSWSRDSVKRVKFIKHLKKAALVQYGVLPVLSMCTQVLFPVLSRAYTRALFGAGTLAITIMLGLVFSHKEGVFLQYKVDMDKGAVSIMEIGDLRKD